MNKLFTWFSDFRFDPLLLNHLKMMKCIANAHRNPDFVPNDNYSKKSVQGYEIGKDFFIDGLIYKFNNLLNSKPSKHEIRQLVKKIDKSLILDEFDMVHSCAATAGGDRACNEIWKDVKPQLLMYKAA